MAGNNIMNLADMNITTKKNRADPRVLIDMMMGFQKSQIIFTATSLGIFEELSRSAKPISATQLAGKLHLDPDATERLLNGCVSLGLLTVEEDVDTVTYGCCQMTSMFLVKSSRMSLRPLVQQIGDMYTLWGRMTNIVKTGQSEMGSLNGDYFGEGEGFYITEKKQIEFLQTMHMFSKQDAPHILKNVDLKQYNSACDLGGATGAFARELANKYQGMQVSVLELPHVVKAAHHFQDNCTPSNFQFISGDFFLNPLPPADLYILSHVIHDWSVDKIETLLTKIYNTLKKGGALLILEKLLNDTKTGPSNAIMLDLNMLVGCEGRERSAEEYRNLLRKSGFYNIQITSVPTAMHRDIILAKKI